jgi:hypothetical protein
MFYFDKNGNELKVDDWVYYGGDTKLHPCKIISPNERDEYELVIEDIHTKQIYFADSKFLKRISIDEIGLIILEN